MVVAVDYLTQSSDSKPSAVSSIIFPKYTSHRCSTIFSGSLLPFWSLGFLAWVSDIFLILPQPSMGEMGEEKGLEVSDKGLEQSVNGRESGQKKSKSSDKQKWGLDQD